MTPISVLAIPREYKLLIHFLLPDLRSVLDFLNTFLREEELFLDFREEVELFSEDTELLREDWEFLIEEVELLKEEAILDKEVKESFLVTLKFSFPEDFLLLFREFSPGDPSELRSSLSSSDNDCRSASGKGCNSVSDSEDCPTGSGRRPKGSSLDVVAGFFTVFRMLLRHCSHCLLSC